MRKGTDMKLCVSRLPLIPVLGLLAVLPSIALAGIGKGEITLTVDATEVTRRILHASETIPVNPGPLTLQYPKWIPGEHGPSGPVADFASLKIHANGKSIAWRRDLVDMYSVHLDVPDRAKNIDVVFDFLQAARGPGFSSGGSGSDQLAAVNWNQVVLYPKGIAPGNILVLPSVRLPNGWKYGTALELKGQSNDTVHFSAVSLTTLVDSPVKMGVHFRQIDITPENGVRHTIIMVADGEAALDMPDWQAAAYRRLVLEANALFGARHYSRYDFLLTLSSQTANYGLEHHECSDDCVPERTLIDSSVQKLWALLLPHEFAHSWNGKYRRPAGLTPDDFQKPQTGELLWVYEGLTTYFGEILAVRCGISNPEDSREHLALVAARLDNLPGRTWRSLQDVSDAAQILYGSRSDWQSIRRTVDFYDESYLIWLEADVLIRSLTEAKKSLNDFCRNFFGGQDGAPEVRTFTYDDIISGLNAIAPYDWKAFWSQRLDSLDPHAPLGGIERGGWRLTFREAKGGMATADEDVNHTIDARFSLGVTFAEDGMVTDVIPGFPAAAAGLAPGMKLIAIDGRKFTKESYRDAMKGGTTSSRSMEFLVANGDYFSTLRVDYHGGERYPALERDSSRSDVLGEIMHPIGIK